MKYYAVVGGPAPGVYNSWDEAKEVVLGIKGAQCKKFSTKKLAKSFCIKNTQTQSSKKKKVTLHSNEKAYAYIDGSYNSSTKTYGYGGMLIINNYEYILQGSGSNESLVSSRNIAGEIMGAISAIQKARELGIDELTLYYDYEGIEKWATREWEAKKLVSTSYVQYINQVSKTMKLNFVHVKGHSGDNNNNRADKLAKKAVGL